ncbi:hypothetical protein B0J12DRAFT_205918 [Macrophomina phaseolina]|uniref:Uncharacterized protein n=1 Tax=Macrophomina phaseolina TaxID=35725 RepID=A0ABQ8G298_9PEZI|nr:hypothetical protein B0J12DRAFT_205918 [Macrophomina phaseolina]
MPFSSCLISLGMLACAGAAMARLNFETDATLHDYPSMAGGAGANNPPWCEVAYAGLDLNSITAYCAIDKSTCGTCLEVCGSVGCKYMLAIDQCSRGDGLLDISTGAGMEICGSDTGHHQVKATQVDAAKCQHIWDGNMYFSYQAPYGGLATLASLINGEQQSGPAAGTGEATEALTSTATTSIISSSTSTSTSSSETEPVSVYSAPAQTLPPSTPVPAPSYSSPDTETVSAAESFTVVSSNSPWSIPSSTAFSAVAPFANSSAPVVPVATPSLDGSNNQAPSVTKQGGQASESIPVCSRPTVTVTVPGLTQYVTVVATLTNGVEDGDTSPASSTPGVLAESAASGPSTSSSTTTIRSTSTIWYTNTITLTACPPGATNCPESLQAPGLTTQATVVPSVAASIYYPIASGAWNGTQPSNTHRPVDIPNAAAASAGAYAAEVKARAAVPASFPHAKRSAASYSAGSKGWEAIFALSSLTAALVIAL